VPQQNGDECGIYVLYFIRCFLLNKKLTEVLENKKLEEKFTQLVCHLFPPLYLVFYCLFKCLTNVLYQYDLV
jgi:hypothetical protein